MNDIGREGADHAAEYLGAIKGTWPLLLLAGGVAFASAVYQLKRGYRQRTAAQKCATVLLNTVLTASLAMGGAFLLPLFMPEATAQTQMGVVFLLGGLGGETVKQWLFARLRLSVVDLMNPDDINDIRKTMDPETRRKHAAQCPFRGDECRTTGSETA